MKNFLVKINVLVSKNKNRFCLSSNLHENSLDKEKKAPDPDPQQTVALRPPRGLWGLIRYVVKIKLCLVKKPIH